MSDNYIKISRPNIVSFYNKFSNNSSTINNLEDISISKDDAKHIIHHIKKCTELFANVIIDTNMQIYEESNSGFLPFMLDYKLIKKGGDHYHTPIIDQLYNEKYLSA